MTNAQKFERKQAVIALKKLLRPNKEVYCILRHASASGMSRVIDLAIVRKGEVRRIGWWAAQALGFRYDRKHEGIRIGGTGMDMGFALVYELGAALWPRGTRKPHGTRNGQPDSAGGYALKHVWL